MLKIFCKFGKAVVKLNMFFHLLIKKRDYVTVAQRDDKRTPRYAHKLVKQSQRENNAQNEVNAVISEFCFAKVGVLFLNYGAHKIIVCTGRKIRFDVKRYAESRQHHTDDKEHNPQPQPRNVERPEQVDKPVKHRAVNQCGSKRRQINQPELANHR